VGVLLHPSPPEVSGALTVAQSFRCRVVTPIASLVSEEVKYVQIPAWDGSMGFLPGRAPILARLGAGELRLDIADTAKGQGGTRSYFLVGGVAKMQGAELLVLAEKATPAENVSLADAEAEYAKAAAINSDAGRAAAQTARAKVAFAKKTRGGI
jgi:F-type H+-transporting ATPase subunit epsilon